MLITLESSTLPKGPLYDPKSKIKNFFYDEDFDNISRIATREQVLYVEPRPHPVLGEDIEWLRPKEICARPHFIRGKPTRFDALQGDLGNCWLVIAIEGLTFNEELYQFVVPTNQSFDQNYTGAFHFRFWQLGTWYDVVIDDRLPVYKHNNELCYVRSKSGNVFWAALLEKAYCKICGRRSSDYASLKTGISTTSFQDLTGGIVEFIDPKKAPPGRSLRWFLRELFMKRSLAGCLISKGQIPDGESGMHTRHSYLVSGVAYDDDKNSVNCGLSLVRVMNPWGDFEWTGEFRDEDYDRWQTVNKKIREDMQFKVENDGEFWMKENDFSRIFTFVHVCHLGPYQFHYCRTRYRVTNWCTKAFRGEWVKNFSAGGPHNDKRHINPQYKILLKRPDSAPKDSFVSVVIEITQRSLVYRAFTTGVCFYVYSLSNLTDHKVNLEKPFFETNSPINDVDFTRTEGRAYVDSFNIFPGWYCIVPCASEGDETSFLLRIYTECEVDQWEYDGNISKSSITEVEPNETTEYKELKHIFDEAAQDGEVDWIGLKDIFKRSSNILIRSLSTRPSKGHENEHIVFSKDDCRSMIAMLDDDNTGKLNYREFCSLLKKINFWQKIYGNFKESDGFITVNKLGNALSSLGFNLNKQVVHRLVHLYANEQGGIVLTDFILCGVILETFFTRNQKDKTGKDLMFTLEEWVNNALTV